MTDQEKCELVVARVLSLLLDRGIREAAVKFDDLDLDDSFRAFHDPCVRWLCDEEIIRWAGVKLETPIPTRIGGYVLTAKGYKVLGHSISINGRSVSNAELVKEKSKGSTNYAGIGDFLGGLAGGFTKSLGS